MSDVLESEAETMHGSSWRGRLAAGVRLGLDLVLPPRCLACGAIAGADGGVCAECWRGLEFISAPMCPVTGLPFAYDPGAGILSGEALLNAPAYDRARAVLRYNDPARALVHGLKYRDRLEGAPAYARWMAAAAGPLLADCDMIVPVPLHGFRRWWRRYNQSALLAAALGRASGKPVAQRLLLRPRATRPQVGLDRDARKANVEHAFTIAPGGHGRLKDRRVLLIDDVITTGATVEACAIALKSAGAVEVDALALARVVAHEATVP